MTAPTNPLRSAPAQLDVADLRKLLATATDEDLTDDGRYFADTFHDLTKCWHGDTGEYQHQPDGKLVEWLWNNRRTIADTIDALRAERDALAARVADLQTSVVAFGATWAVSYARDCGLPTGHLDPVHYDILKDAGARMDDFTRATPENPHA